MIEPFRIYYGDNTTYSGPPELAPARDVQVIIQPDDDHGWASQTGADYYVWDERGDGPRWWGVDKFGLYDYLISPGFKKVLFGRTVTSERYQHIFFRAKRDAGSKTAFRRRERKP